MRGVAVIAPAIFAVALAGCGHTVVHDALLRPRDPIEPRSRAELYMGTALPSRPVYDVALVQAVGFGADATLEDVTGALAARGGQLGCDAVVRVTVDQGLSLAHAYGVCVRYAPTAPRVETPPPPTPAPERPAEPRPVPEAPERSEGLPM